MEHKCYECDYWEKDLDNPNAICRKDELGTCPVEDEKAFYWECVYCGSQIEEGDVVFVQEGFMSGNTPVFHKSHPYHLKCYILKHGEEECYFLSTNQK